MSSTLHGAVWAVAPDPASAAPSARLRWAAGWASLSPRAPLVIHLPAPASASAHVALDAFNVVRTRTVALDQPLAPPLTEPPAHAPPADPELPSASRPQGHTPSSSFSTWLRQRRPAPDPARSGAPRPKSEPSRAWQVELLAVARVACDTTPVTWSDFDTGANVAGQSNTSSPPRFVFRVASADQANDWASALAPLLDANQTPAQTPVPIAPTDAPSTETPASPPAPARPAVRPYYSPQLSPSKAFCALHDEPQCDKRTKSYPAELDNRGKPKLLQRVRLLPRVRSERNLRSASQTSQLSPRGGHPFSPIASPESPTAPTPSLSFTQSPVAEPRGPFTQPSSPMLGKPPSPPPKMDLRRRASSNRLHPGLPSMHSCGDLLRTPSRMPSPIPSHPSSEIAPSPPLPPHGALELFNGDLPIRPPFDTLSPAVKPPPKMSPKTLPRVASMPHIHLVSQAHARRKRNSLSSTPGARSAILPAASQLVGPRPPPLRRKRRSLTGSPFTSDEDRELTPDEIKLVLHRLEATRSPRPAPTLDTEKYRSQALIMAALSSSDGVQAGTWDALEPSQPSHPSKTHARTHPGYATWGRGGYDAQNNSRAGGMYAFLPLTPPADMDMAPSPARAPVSTLAGEQAGQSFLPAWERYDVAANMKPFVSTSAYDYQHEQGQAYDPTTQTPPLPPGAQAAPFPYDQLRTAHAPLAAGGADGGVRRDRCDSAHDGAHDGARDGDIYCDVRHHAAGAGRPALRTATAPFPTSTSTTTPSARLALLPHHRGPGRAVPYPCVPPPLH